MQLIKIRDCPYCKKQAFKCWEFFIVASPFWMTKRCRYCNKQLRFNYNLFYRILLFIAIAIGIRKLIDFFVSFEFVFFDAILYLVFVLIPLRTGGRLVKEGE